MTTRITLTTTTPMTTKNEIEIENALILKCMSEPRVRGMMNILLELATPKYKGSNPEFIIAAHHRREAINYIRDRLEDCAPAQYKKMVISKVENENAR